MNDKRFNYILLSILLLFSFLTIWLITSYKEIWWDPAVYVGMGKYIFSYGESGLWEPSRPLVMPVIYGIGYKIYSNITFLRIINSLFGLGCLILTYFISKTLFNKKTALISTFLLGFSSTFFFFNTMTLTGIPSTFFGLYAIYLIIKKKHFLAGILAGISFMTRFLQLWIFIILFIFTIKYIIQKKKQLNYIFKLIFGFLIIIAPYLIFNQILYGSMLYPLQLQSYMTNVTGWLWHEPWYFYFFNLLKENILIIFVIPGIYYLTKKIKDDKKMIILSIALLFLLFFTVIKHKEMRFVVVFLPYLYMITSFGIIKLVNKIKQKNIQNTILFISTIVILIQFSILTIPVYSYSKINPHQHIQNYLTNLKINNGIWISNPVYSLNSDKKIDYLMYYPTFNHDKYLDTQKNLPKANLIIINFCDLYCEPYNEHCFDDKENLMILLKENFIIKTLKTDDNCPTYSFTRPEVIK